MGPSLTCIGEFSWEPSKMFIFQVHVKMFVGFLDDFECCNVK